jgi:5'-nucleotidase / UDP-sugar diphosphatase
MKVGDEEVKDDRLYTVASCDRPGAVPETLCRFEGGLIAAHYRSPYTMQCARNSGGIKRSDPHGKAKFPPKTRLEKCGVSLNSAKPPKLTCRFNEPGKFFMKTRIKNERIKASLLIYIFLILTVSVFFATGESYGQKRRQPVRIAAPSKPAEKPLPDLKLPDLSGKGWSLHANRGRVVLMNFWATWCAPCRAETPMLVKLGEEYKSKGLEIVGVALDDNGAGNIEKFVAEYKVDYPILLPVPDSALSRIDPVPTTLLIDAEGRLAKKYVGAMPENVLRADIEKLTRGLKVKNSEPKNSSGAKTAVNLKARSLTILHTNDIHGHLESWQGWEKELKDKTVGGLARLAAEIEKVRAEIKPENALLLDAGDTIGDTMIAAETEGRAIIETMNLMRYDAMTPGNHEPDFTAEKLRDRIREAKFPVLAANIVDKTDGKLFTKPYLIKTVGGVRVGILGLAYPNTPMTTAKKNVEKLNFRDAVETALEYVPRLRSEGAEIIIALTHLGLSADRNLAEKIEGIDVIVGGHSHNRMTEALRVRDTLIVQAGAHGSDLGRLDLTVENGRITNHNRTLIPIIDSEAEKSVASVIEKQTAPFKVKLDENIGQASNAIVRVQTLPGNEPEKRDAESPADSLFADAIREEAKTEIVFLPGLGYGVAIQPGAITANELKNLIPHDSAVFTMKLAGAQIREILEQAIENVYTTDVTKKVGGMIQISGLRFAYDPNQVRGNRVKEITVGDKPLEQSRLYMVATNGLLAEGGHSQKTFLAGTHKREAGKQYETVKKWIAAKKIVSAAPTNRIRKIGENKK